MRATATAFALIVVLCMSALPGSAQQETPQGTIERLNAALLDVMRQADELGYAGRFEQLEPILDEVYNFPVMAQIAVGRSAWAGFSEEQRATLQQSFRRMSIATYAARFDGHSGEYFEISGTRDGARGSKLVQTRIVRPSDDPVALNYVLREFDGRWRVLDVLLDGSISEMSRQRSEFSSVLQRDGFDALISEIDGTTRRLAAEA